MKNSVTNPIDTEEKIKQDVIMYKELFEVQRLSPGGHLIEGGIFNHGQKNAYDEYKKYVCYHSTDIRNPVCKAMVKQWMESDRWFLIRDHSSSCKNKDLADWQIQEFIDRVEKFYLTDGRRKGGFKTSKKIEINEKINEKIIKKRRRFVNKKRKSKYCESDNVDESDSSEDDFQEVTEFNDINNINYFNINKNLIKSSGNTNSNTNSTSNNNFNFNHTSIKTPIDYEEAYHSLQNELTSKDEEIKMLNNTIDRLVIKVEEERRLKDRLKELLSSLQVNK